MTIPRLFLRTLLAGVLSVAMGSSARGQPTAASPAQDPRQPAEFKGEAKVNVHAIAMRKGEAYRITVKADGFVPQLQIEGRRGSPLTNLLAAPAVNPITTSTDPKMAPAARRDVQMLFMPEVTKVYQIKVDFAAYTEIGKGPHGYTLTIERAVAKPQAVFTNAQLALGDHSKRLEQGKAYGITVTGKGVAPEVQVLDGTRSLATAGGGRWYGFGPDAEFIVTMTFMPPRTTDYRFLLALGPVSQLRNVPSKYTMHVVELKMALSVAAQLTAQDPAYPGRGGRHKVHAIKLESDKNYQIDMASWAFEPRLFIEDSAGKVLMQDDGSGVNLNAHLVFRPNKTDTYRIVATTFEKTVPGRSFGPYTLTVVETPPTQPGLAAPPPVGKGLQKSKN